MSSPRPQVDVTERPWNDERLVDAERVAALIEAMTLREKVAQLYGVWIGSESDGGEVAPHQNEMGQPVTLDELLRFGLGQLTRSFGTTPLDPAVGAAQLARTQQKIVAANRFGIPALAHEECLAGFTTWGATAYPVPLSWGATFDPEIIRTMAEHIGAGMRSVGVHQGLAPVLDVTRDARWGRTEETIGEDPYLVGTVACAYIKGLESAGIVATLKHFVGYSASKGARNLAPVSMGPRELADVMLAPFEMAVRESGVRSVMHSYADIDGVPAAANRELLTTLLRDTWGFDGTVVADYFGIGFLKLLHGVAETWGEAGALALTAGVDVELPGVKTYAEPLIAEIEAGRVSADLVDRALERVLRQKLDLGLLDADWDAVPAALAGLELDSAGPDGLDTGNALVGTVDLDPPADREVARHIAEKAVVLLRNDGILPLGSPGPLGITAAPRRIALVGPGVDDPMTMLGCYSFPSHVGVKHPELPIGIDIPTVRDAIVAEFPDAEVSFSLGCSIDGIDRSGLETAVAEVADADVAIVVLGDRAGLFGRGTSGEGCDAESLQLPGIQSDLLERLLETGTRVIVVLVSGRPYALGSAPERAAAIVQTFFAGEEGAGAIAGVLSGRVDPSGRLPVSVPRHPGAQPSTYLGAALTEKSSVSNIDPTPAYGFGHGLSFTAFEWSDLVGDGAEATTDGTVSLSFTIRNSGKRFGTELAQVYLHDPVASVTRPVQRLIAYVHVPLEPGESARVSVEIPADVSSFTGLRGQRIVEPGALEFRLAASSRDVRLTASARLSGEVRTVDHTRELHCAIRVDR
ncbi:MAG: beta-xylosidase [Actinomycetota bacterium]|nr:beta-xylosidase [Actinomycetota bacterium]